MVSNIVSVVLFLLLLVMTCFYTLQQCTLRPLAQSVKLSRPRDHQRNQQGQKFTVDSEKANVLLATMENRFCNPGLPGRWKKDHFRKVNMRKAAAALNLHYADLHGYTFTMFCDLLIENGTAEAWGKIKALKYLMQLAKQQQYPTYVVVLDSDAYFHAMYMELEYYMEKQNTGIKESSWSILVSKENIVGSLSEINQINTGVLYGYVDPTDTSRYEKAISALDSWVDASCNICEEFKQNHPWEQGCLEVLLGLNSTHPVTPNPLVKSAIAVSPLHMNAWNGPWGTFVRHIWGGPGKEMRGYAFVNEVASHQVDVQHAYERIIQNLTAPQLVFDPRCK